MSKELAFECPKCGYNKVEEVVGVDGTINHCLTAIMEDGSYAYDGDGEIDGDSFLVKFQCYNCSFIIAETEEELVEFLKEQPCNQ